MRENIDSKRKHMPTLNWLSRDEDIRAARRLPYRLLEEVPIRPVTPERETS